MYGTTFWRVLMQIQLNDADLEKMPHPLRLGLLDWLGRRNLKSATNPDHQISEEEIRNPAQLTLAIESPQVKQNRASTVTSNKSSISKPSSSSPKSYRQESFHIRLTQLFDAGITRSGMPVRIRLLRELEKQLGHRYVTAGLTISKKGTVIYQGEEFDKPSPLAQRVIGSTVNGWEYVEIQKNGKWICLDELRKIWRLAYER